MYDLDFTPPNFHAARCLRSAIRLRASLIGTMLVLMVLWIVANRNEVSTAKAMLSDVQQQREQAAIHQVRKAQMEEEQALLRAHENLLRHLENRVSLAVVFSEVSRCIGEPVILTAVSVECPSVAAYADVASLTLRKGTAAESPDRSSTSGAAPGETTTADGSVLFSVSRDGMGRPREPHLQPVRLVLTGMSTDVADVIMFVKVLEDSPLIAQVHLEQRGPTTWSGRRGQAFVITCQLVDQHLNPLSVPSAHAASRFKGDEPGESAS